MLNVTLSFVLFSMCGEVWIVWVQGSPLIYMTIMKNVYMQHIPFTKQQISHFIFAWKWLIIKIAIKWLSVVSKVSTNMKGWLSSVRIFIFHWTCLFFFSFTDSLCKYCFCVKALSIMWQLNLLEWKDLACVSMIICALYVCVCFF